MSGPAPTNITGRRYGNVTVLGFSGRRGNKSTRIFEVQCDCGVVRFMTISNLERWPPKTHVACVRAQQMELELEP